MTVIGDDSNGFMKSESNGECRDTPSLARCEGRIEFVELTDLSSPPGNEKILGAIKKYNFQDDDDPRAI